MRCRCVPAVPARGPEYLAKNDFDFTVLVDDNYVERAGVSAWPTTWFVDREGYIQFVKIGTALKLDEEFSWRVEALREETTSP
ncbi:TlpA family protein disulfide reductase [Candidatus Palauibacter sp.]|uniref:TlpA family protein disulfide reductase n=1 Tax=Candidatus Palauibacter sp. TaxID=3101350 RepID=UPI003B51B68C